MHAKFFFQMTDQNVHRGHVPRITANEQRVKRKRLSKTRIFYAFCSMLINRLIRSQSDKARQFLDQVPKFIQRPTPQPFKSKCVTLFTVFQKSLIACKIRGENPSDLCIHICLRISNLEFGSILPTNFIIGIDRRNIHVGNKIAPTI